MSSMTSPHHHLASFRPWALACAIPALCFGSGCVSSGPEPILSGQPTPKFVAPDVEGVFIASQSGNHVTISRFDKRKQQVEQIATVTDTMTQFTVHDDYLYWLRQAQPNGSNEQPVIMRIHKYKGGSPEPAVKSRVPVTGFSFDATHMYWTQGGNPKDQDETLTPGVLRVMTIGNLPTNFVTKQPGTTYNPALSGAFLFWVVNNPDGSFSVMTTRKGGHEPPRELYQIPSEETEGSPPPLAADDQGVYALTHSSVMHIDQSNGQVRRLFKPIHPRTDWLLLDIDTLYFNAQGRGFVSLATQGSPPKVVNSAQVPFAALDDRFIYWTTQDSVLRLAK